MSDGVEVVCGADVEPIPPRPRRGGAVIELSREPVAVRGEVLDEIWWRGAMGCNGLWDRVS